MVNKFTAIYTESWVACGQRVEAVKIKRFEQRDDETIVDAMEREGIAEDTRYLFVGHPLLHGENNIT